MDLEVLLAAMYEIAGAKILDSFYNLLGVDLSIFFAADWTNPFCSIFFLWRERQGRGTSRCLKMTKKCLIWTFTRT